MQLTHFTSPGDVMLAWAKHYAEAVQEEAAEAEARRLNEQERGK